MFTCCKISKYFLKNTVINTFESTFLAYLMHIVLRTRLQEACDKEIVISHMLFPEGEFVIREKDDLEFSIL